MATKVLDLEIEELPTEITGLAPYEQAFVLLRYHGRPVGQVWLPVLDDGIDQRKLRDALSHVSWWPLWQSILQGYLDWDEKVTLTGLQPTATVAVCTRDRPQDLERCLNALMKLPDDGQEFLVIDNCPATNATKEVVARYSQRVRYVREDYPGLNRARNRALAEARNDIVAFTDDDATPDAGWLRALLRNFDDPLVLCVTGLTVPRELETEAQEWFELYSSFNRGFTRRTFYRGNLNPILAGHVGAGANMALRRDVLKLTGPFDNALDAGTPTHSGGDNELFSRVLASGYRIVYEPAALSWHRHRRTWKELRKTLYGYGVGIYAAWTRSLLVERELDVPLIALSWFVKGQLPSVLRSILRRPHSVPFNLLLAELLGCAVGPWTYLFSRRHIR